MIHLLNHRKLTKEDRYYIENAEEYNNCALCAIASKGSMTQEEVGKHLGLTKMRISQIERQAIQKLKKKAKFLSEF